MYEDIDHFDSGTAVLPPQVELAGAVLAGVSEETLVPLTVHLVVVFVPETLAADRTL